VLTVAKAQAHTTAAVASDRSHRYRFGLDHWITVERTMINARWVAVAFGLLQVAVYDAVPYPPGYQVLAYLLLVPLGLTNVAAIVGVRRVTTARGGRWIAALTLIADIVVVAAFVWLYGFDDGSLHFLLFFVLPAEAALKFGMAGAIGAWAACTAVYAARDVWTAAQYGFPVNMPSTAYRMGFLLIVSLVFGSFARRLAARTGELEDAMKRLEAEERWRSALIDMLAHDLRAPVGTATSALETLEQRAEALDSGQIRDIAGRAIRQNKRALALADDILTMARVRHEQLALQREEIALADFVRQVIAEQSADDGEVVDVDVPTGLTVNADARRLEQILSNLLSNARKHGRPPIAVAASTDDDGTVKIQVVDGGEGVPADQQVELFEQFSVGPRRDSVGLGLWVVRTLTEAHGGSVTHSVADGRSTFEVVFPRPEREPSRV
jgi:signal transduction histidine kinase